MTRIRLESLNRMPVIADVAIFRAPWPARHIATTSSGCFARRYPGCCTHVSRSSPRALNR